MNAAKSNSCSDEPGKFSAEVSDAKSDLEKDAVPADKASTEIPVSSLSSTQPPFASEENAALNEAGSAAEGVQPEAGSVDEAVDAPKPRGRPFAPGVSGNPHGRPKGALGTKTIMARAKLVEHLDELIDVGMEKARSGSLGAIKFMLSLAMEQGDGEFVNVDVNALQSPADCRDAVGYVVKEVSRGKVPIRAGKKFIELIEARRKSFDHFDDEIDYERQRANYEFVLLCSQFPIDLVDPANTKMMDVLRENVFDLPLSTEKRHWIWNTFLEGLEWSATRKKEIEAEMKREAEKTRKESCEK